MKLRFSINQAEAFRRGVDTPKSIATVEVNPSKLSQDQRNLIADRLDGIDVCKLFINRKGEVEKGYYRAEEESPYNEVRPIRIEAILPTFESLMEAIQANQREIEAEIAKAKAKKQSATPQNAVD